MKQAMVRRGAGIAAFGVVLSLCVAGGFRGISPIVSRVDAAQPRTEGQAVQAAPSAGSPRPAASPAASSPQAQPQGNAEKPAEEVFKNIQVLKGIPASQLRPMMNLIRASLNVRCDFCHVIQAGQGFEKDEKEPKKPARKMIQMVLDINKTNFAGRTEVTCFTCHHGEHDPVSIPPVGVASAPAPRAEGTPTAARPPAEPLPQAADLLARYAKAIGGKEAVERLKTRAMKGSIMTAQGASLPVEVDREAPNKYIITITTPRGTVTRGFDGATGWTLGGQGQRAMSLDELAQMKAEADFYREVDLKDRLPRARVTGKEKIGDRETYVMVARDTDNRRERLFFDTTSGLLFRRIMYTDTVLGSIPEQTDFEDYQNIDGVKLPMTVKVAGIENNANMTQKFTEVKHNVSFDAAKFKAPESK